MSTIKRQNEKAKTAIVALKQENGNDVCADCSKQGNSVKLSEIWLDVP